MDAWHIRVQHAAPRYHIGSAKEYDRNHNHSCPFVTWAFRQPQALAQLAVKPFWQCQWKPATSSPPAHHVSPPSTQILVPGSQAEDGNYKDMALLHGGIQQTSKPTGKNKNTGPYKAKLLRSQAWTTKPSYISLSTITFQLELLSVSLSATTTK